MTSIDTELCEGRLSAKRTHKLRTPEKIMGLVDFVSERMSFLWSHTHSDVYGRVLTMKNPRRVFRERFKERFALAGSLMGKFSHPFGATLLYESALEAITAGSFTTNNLFLSVEEEKLEEIKRFLQEKGFAPVAKDIYSNRKETVVVKISERESLGIIIEMDGFQTYSPPPEKITARLIRECESFGSEECGLWAMILFSGFSKMENPLSMELLLEYMNKDERPWREIVERYFDQSEIPFKRERKEQDR